MPRAHLAPEHHAFPSLLVAQVAPKVVTTSETPLARAVTRTG